MPQNRQFTSSGSLSIVYNEAYTRYPAHNNSYNVDIGLNMPENPFFFLSDEAHYIIRCYLYHGWNAADVKLRLASGVLQSRVSYFLVLSFSPR